MVISHASPHTTFSKKKVYVVTLAVQRRPKVHGTWLGIWGSWIKTQAETFDPRLPQKIQQKFPAKFKYCFNRLNLKRP